MLSSWELFAPDHANVFLCRNSFLKLPIEKKIIHSHICTTVPFFIKVFVGLDLGVCALRTAFLQCDMAFMSSLT